MSRPEVTFGNRRIDVLGIAQHGWQVIAFEIKTSMADFRAEINQPEKRMGVSRFCSGFFFVCPEYLISATDIPEDVGLIWLCRDGFFRVICESACSHSAIHPALSAVHEAQDAISSWNLMEWHSMSDIAGEDLPRWFLPQYRRPLCFDEDVSLIAESMCSVRLPADAVNFEEVPF